MKRVLLLMAFCKGVKELLDYYQLNTHHLQRR